MDNLIYFLILTLAAAQQVFKKYHASYRAVAVPYKVPCSGSAMALMSTVKGIVIDSNNIILWHESEDIHKRSFISKISVDSDFTFSSYA